MPSISYQLSPDDIVWAVNLTENSISEARVLENKLNAYHVLENNIPVEVVEKIYKVYLTKFKEIAYFPEGDLFYSIEDAVDHLLSNIEL